MKLRRKFLLVLTILGFSLWLGALPALAKLPGFDYTKMSDMSDFDPNQPTIQSGDTIKIGLVESFSGPAAIVGQWYRFPTHWVAYDINKRGGIYVDGKMKKIQIILGNSMGKPSVVKKVAERLILRDKVDILWGTSGSHNTKILAQVAKKYKKILMNPMSLADALHDGKNFNRYTFRTTLNTTMAGNSLAYFYAKRPETKFYILNQDYLLGHSMAAAFKNGLKKFKPDAKIVGETYHPLFTKDFAPYVTKVKATDAEVVFTADWDPDSANLIRQAHGLGLRIPFAHIYADSMYSLLAIGPQAGVGQVNANDYMISVDTPTNKHFIKIWNDRWTKGYAKPYDNVTFKWPASIFGRTTEATYWLMDVIRRAGSTDAEKIIKVWEGDKWIGLASTLEMRACDHQVIRDLFATEFVFPNPYHSDAASYGKPVIMPREIAEPPVPKDLKRCNQ
ncbi:MAG: ABC transporter substrate-binding protein [Deltaproteobacteria bacterium]|nr:ABC transporter substrate-binding protein [Deltaproteobacteria bacterium]MBT4639595.1 ABC transporter substrate-binding protein [Deltaproteobacteria bacterium]MBT6503972.1 ABC transporter substrate-binding protein [Deltaproteobacteria bacterium]MBT6616341.1 ABC transporter substrate-binding protein [Deltaproteobacteria bacterium]MBT7153315.1 ABC transporter substrate-binding protein [Deltaproteobacteria bacterium]